MKEGILRGSRSAQHIAKVAKTQFPCKHSAPWFCRAFTYLVDKDKQALRHCG